MDEGPHAFEVFPDLGFEIETWPLLSDGQAFAVEFIARVVYESRYPDGRVAWEFQDAESSSSPAPIPDRAKAEWHVQGSVKWDGCCNYKYNQDQVMLHICGPGDWEREAELMRAVYRLAHKAMPDSADFGFDPPAPH